MEEEEQYSEKEIREAKLENLRARLRGCATLARSLDLDEVNVAVLRAIAIVPDEAEDLGAK